MKKLIMLITTIFILIGHRNVFSMPINEDEIKTIQYTIDREDYYKLVNEKGNKVNFISTNIDEAAVKEKIYNGLNNLEESIDVSEYYSECSIYDEGDKISLSRLGELYFDILYENPEIFYSDNSVKWSYSYYKESGKISSISLNITYLYNEDIILEMKSKLDSKLQEIKNKYLSVTTNKLQLEYIIHDYILNNTEYDYDNYINGTVSPISHSAYGALIDGKAVCDGYSKAAKLLFNEVKIESGIIVSDEMNHSWNYVNIDNNYYQLDITWDDPAPETNRIRYSYFNLSDSEMGKDHTWPNDLYPECNSDYFKFLRNNYSMNSIARIDDKIYILDNGKLSYVDLYGDNKTIEKESLYGNYLTSYGKSLIFINGSNYEGSVVKYNTINKLIKNMYDLADYIYIKKNILYVENGTTTSTVALNEDEDFNNDNVVDIKDLAELAIRYGQDINSMDWDSRYDLNNDGIIDIYDLILVSKLI